MHSDNALILLEKILLQRVVKGQRKKNVHNFRKFQGVCSSTSQIMYALPLNVKMRRRSDCINFEPPFKKYNCMCNVLQEFNLLFSTKGTGKQSIHIYFL